MGTRGRVFALSCALGGLAGAVALGVAALGTPAGAAGPSTPGALSVGGIRVGQVALPAGFASVGAATAGPEGPPIARFSAGASDVALETGNYLDVVAYLRSEYHLALAADLTAYAAYQQVYATEAASAAAAHWTDPNAGASGTWARDANGAVIPSPAVWLALRTCESGDDYAEDTGNGFYGAYQFDLGTWQGMGEAGYPNDAPPAVQDAAAEELQAARGWEPWPGCRAKLGLG